MIYLPYLIFPQTLQTVLYVFWGAQKYTSVMHCTPSVHRGRMYDTIWDFVNTASVAFCFLVMGCTSTFVYRISAYPTS